MDNVIARRLEVATEPTPSSSKMFVNAALDEHRRLWLHVDALNWLLNYIHMEKMNGGVVPLEESPEDSPAVAEERDTTGGVYWNFRDNNWNARAKDIHGNCLQVARGVKRRQKAESLDFQTAKQVTYEELQQWVSDVKDGKITKDDL